jgi:hypothetical protein
LCNPIEITAKYFLRKYKISVFALFDNMSPNFIPFVNNGDAEADAYFVFIGSQGVTNMARGDRFSSGSLAEVIDRASGHRTAIETWARISLVRIELLAFEAMTGAPGVDTYLKYAEAVGNAAQGQQA